MTSNHVYWLCAFTISYFLSIGLFGYGTDYYAIYHKSVWRYGHFLDYLGMYLVGIHFKNMSLGILAVSMLQYLCYYLLFRKSKRKAYWYFIALLISFGWAHFMQSLNMLRQGLSINLLIVFMLMYKKSYATLILHIFTHKISAATLPVLLIFRNLRFNYITLLAGRVFIIILMMYFLPDLTTITRGIDLALFIIVIVVASEIFVLQAKNSTLYDEYLLLMLANTLISYFLITGGNAYAERLFLSFFPVYFFVLASKIKLNVLGIVTILTTSVLYVLISWTIGPLRTLV